MRQNTSSAVMAQRREPKDSLDLFPTPPWATRALCHWLRANLGYDIRLVDCWEPAAGHGDMVRPLGEFFSTVHASDVYRHTAEIPVFDFLFPGAPLVERPAWIITNPPFRLAAEFIRRALMIAHQGVAMLVRTAFLEGIERHATLFAVDPPTAVLQFTERVAMVRGRLDEEASSATAYCWVVWAKIPTPPRSRYPEFHWLPPCRRELERPEDYVVAA